MIRNNGLEMENQVQTQIQNLNKEQLDSSDQKAMLHWKIKVFFFLARA